MAGKTRIKDHWNEQRIFDARMLIGMVVVIALALLLVGKLVWLQVFRHDYYADLAQGNRMRRDPIPANRGLILDRNGTILVENRAAYQLELVREQVPDLDQTLQRLRELGLLAAEDIDKTRRMVRSRRSFEGVPIRLRMTDEEIGRFAVHRFELPGVDLQTRQTRYYPFGEIGVHALGYVASIGEEDLKRIDRDKYEGTTLIGKLGIEAAFEEPLRGHNGYQQIMVNAQGRSVGSSLTNAQLGREAPVKGSDILSSLDLPAQLAAEQALGARRGAVVAIDPANGDVLVLASRPGFDPSLFGRGLTRAEYSALTANPDKPLLNRALRGAYPSGSTIKPVMALAGLQFGKIDPDRREFCSGAYYLRGSSRAFREGKGGRHGAIDLRDAIAKSCDVYFYDLASQLGIDNIASFLAPFGFGEATGIEIGGERVGILPSREWKKRNFRRPADQVWYPGDTVNLGVGQGYFLVTPLQLAHMTSMLANRGISYAPRLVTGVRDERGHVQVLPPKKGREVAGISTENWDRVVAGMIGATTYGTAAGQFNGAPYEVAGKTGTAQVYSVAQTAKLTQSANEALRDHSWFIAFAPANAPRIALCVLVENGGFGASAAAPIARRVIDTYFQSIGLLARPAAAAVAGAP